jgi:hypothetical protein
VQSTQANHLIPLKEPIYAQRLNIGQDQNFNFPKPIQFFNENSRGRKSSNNPSFMPPSPAAHRRSMRRFDLNENVQKDIMQFGVGNMNLQGNIQQINKGGPK